MEFLFFPSELLEAVHGCNIFSDDKEFVDRPLLLSHESLLDRWTSFFHRWNGTPSLLLAFIKDTTAEAGSDLKTVIPVDWKKKTTTWLPDLHGFSRDWAIALHGIWRDLCRSTDLTHPDRHSLLPLPCPFFVPGGRFREVYYWDSYWMVMGLLISEMFTSAMNQIESLMSMLEMHGYIPNGNRRYYTNRSQPPLLAFMLRYLLKVHQTNHQMTQQEKTRAVAILKASLPLLIREHRFWTAPPHGLTLTHGSTSHRLSRYHVTTTTPRPESFGSDMALVKGKANSQLFGEIAAAAESGWDFSSRWCSIPDDLSSLETTSIIPVDLNAALYLLERTISEFSESYGDDSTTQTYATLAAERQQAFDAVFWDKQSHQWRDLHIGDNQVFVRGLYVSNYLPLAFEIDLPKGVDAELLVSGFKSSGLLTEGGCQTSLYDSGQQWDAPNIWPPLQSLMVDGLRQLAVKRPDSGADDLAASIALRFLRSAGERYRRDGCMYEKYGDRGMPGQGGEYMTQIGFGWTNGTVLYLLNLYGIDF